MGNAFSFNNKINERYFNILNNVYNDLLEYHNLNINENNNFYYFKNEDININNKNINNKLNDRKNIIIANKTIYGQLDWSKYGFENITDELKNSIGLIKLVINKKNLNQDYKDNFYELSYSVHNIEKKYKKYINRICDLRYGFIVDKECDIKFYIYDKIYQEFKNCKPGVYYQFNTPIFHFFLNKKLNPDRNYYEALYVTSSQNCQIKMFDLFIDSNIRKKFMNFIKNNYILINEYIYDYSCSEMYNSLKKKEYYYYPHKYNDTSKFLKINFINYKELKIKLFKTYEKELMEKTWHPSRFQNWCLSIDELNDLNL